MYVDGYLNIVIVSEPNVRKIDFKLYYLPNFIESSIQCVIPFYVNILGVVKLKILTIDCHLDCNSGWIGQTLLWQR